MKYNVLGMNDKLAEAVPIDRASISFDKHAMHCLMKRYTSAKKTFNFINTCCIKIIGYL